MMLLFSHKHLKRRIDIEAKIENAAQALERKKAKKTKRKREPSVEVVDASGRGNSPEQEPEETDERKARREDAEQRHNEKRLQRIAELEAKARHRRTEEWVGSSRTSSPPPMPPLIDMRTGRQMGDEAGMEDGDKFGHSVIPKIEPFGTYDAQEQYVEFVDWITLVGAALRFVPGWSDERKMDWFMTKCGSDLRFIISAFDIQPTDEENRFASFVRNIADYFERQSDPAVRHQVFMACVQEAAEPAARYYIRLKRAARGMTIDDGFFREKCIAGLADVDIRNSAITHGWSAQETIFAATRKEGVPKRKPPQTVNVVEEPEVARVVRRPLKRLGKRPAFAKPKNLGQRPPGPNACKACGFSSHRGGKCPAADRECAICKKKGHFAAMCDERRKKSVNEVSQGDW